MYSLSVPKENNPIDNQSKQKDLERLIDLYGNDVLRTAYMFLKDMQKAEDAFQEVFIKVFNKFESFNGDSSEKTWIIKITINVCKDMLRSSWLKRVFLTDKIRSQGRSSDVEKMVRKREDGNLLFYEVMALPPAFKEVTILYYYQQYDTKQISSILDIAEGTVRSRLHRAREILKKKLGGRIDTVD